MNKVESWTKFLKIVSVVCIVAYAVFTVVGIVLATGLMDPIAVLEVMGATGILQGFDAALFVVIVGMVIAVAYAFQLLAAIAVLRGVKNPSKMKLGMVLYGIITVFTGINLVMTFTSAPESVGLAISSFAVAAFMFYGSLVVHRSTK